VLFPKHSGCRLMRWYPCHWRRWKKIKRLLYAGLEKPPLYMDHRAQFHHSPGHPKKCGRPGQKRLILLMKNTKPSWLIKILTRLRDSRLVWDVLGSIYNRRIYSAIRELYNHITQQLAIQADARILDAGSGRGYISLALATSNPRAMITGIDYSFMQVREADKYRRKRKIANCSFHQGNAMNIEFADETFDGAVSVGSIKHWPDALRGLREIHRVLKPGGHLIISETDQEASDNALRQFLGRFQVWFIPNWLLFWGLRHIVFGQSYSETRLAGFMREAGFGHVECQRVATCPYVIVKARK